jgi:hypothetical protein
VTKTNLMFSMIADALKREMEPQGFRVFVRTNDQEIRIQDISESVENGMTWVLKFEGEVNKEI